MASLNKVELIGNMTSEPTVKVTPSNQKVASFSIATNRVWKDSTGAKKEQAEFHNIVAWGNFAEIVEKYLQKGKQVYIEGRLQTRTWEDANDKTKRYKTEIIVENLILLWSKGSSSASNETSSAETASTTSTKTAKKEVVEEEIDIEDIPF